MYGLDPPGTGGKLEQHRGMIPELLEFVDKRVLQLVERREHGNGEVLADMPEDLLSRVQFWTLRWQIERMHASWPPDLTAAMTARTIQHDPNRTLSQLMAQQQVRRVWDILGSTYNARQHEVRTLEEHEHSVTECGDKPGSLEQIILWLQEADFSELTTLLVVDGRTFITAVTR
jgi:hypothetical protein